jgi:hypothetical protein
VTNGPASVAGLSVEKQCCTVRGVRLLQNVYIGRLLGEGRQLRAPPNGGGGSVYTPCSGHSS